jgi:hypothetical protein
MATLNGITFTGTGALTLPSGTTAQRPSQASTLASFTTVGTTSWTCPAGVYSVEVLVVAGGGGGGRHSGGGGGGGGVIYRPAFPVVPGTAYTVTVGGGGSGPPVGTYPGVPGGAGTNGGNSVFGTLTAIGGGAGGWYGGDGQAGGSGGGSTGHSRTIGASNGAGTPGQGFAGAVNNHIAIGYAGGGGGGAGGPGKVGVQQNFNNTVTAITGGDRNLTIYISGGDGGPGYFSNITGQERAYGGGGGGSPQYGDAYAEGGSGGSGVGGDGSPGISTTEGSQYGYDGVANTGGGGGGSHYNAPASTSAGRSGAGGSGVVYLRYNTNDITGAVGGAARHNAARGVEYVTGDGRWTSYVMPFLTRTIITNAYAQGGYKDAVAWNNTNRTVVATDTTTNLGDGTQELSHNYHSGACSKNLAYVFGAPGAHGTASNYIIAFNMRTEQVYASTGSRYMAVSTIYSGTMFKEHYTAWITQMGYGTGVEEFNMNTETLVGTIAGAVANEAGWCMSHENFGIAYGSDSGSRTFHFATRTSTARPGTHPSAHHQQKSVQTKLINGYAGNEGNYAGGNAMRRTNFYTDVTSGTVAKPITNSGEENFTMGQDHQYMLGMYNGLQNNISWRFNYSSETGYTGGASMEPKGRAGMSSAVCAWRD